MTKITYRSDPNDPLVPAEGRPVRSEVVRENFQVLANAGGLWAYDTQRIVDIDSGESLVSTFVGPDSTATLTLIDHGFSPGDNIVISGANETDYNGSFAVVTAPNSDTVTYTITGANPSSPATGTISVRWQNRVGVTGGVFYISDDGGYGSNNPVFFSETVSPELDTTIDGSAAGGSAGEELIALLTVDDTETLVWDKGDWATAGNAELPAFPLITTFEVPICIALVVFDQTEIESASITDVRPLIRI